MGLSLPKATHGRPPIRWCTMPIAKPYQGMLHGQDLDLSRTRLEVWG